MDWGWVGNFVFAPERFYAGMHDGIGLYGRVATAIRKAEHQDYWVERRSRRQPQQVGRGHRRDAGPQSEFPDDWRSGTENCKAVRHVASRGGRELRGTD